MSSGHDGFKLRVVMVEAIVQIVGMFLLDLLWWLILLPVACLVFSPFILVAAFFKPKRYPLAVADMFGSIYWFWRRRGLTAMTGLPNRL